MSLLEDFINKFGFDKLNIMTQYPAILPYQKIENGVPIANLSATNYQPNPINTDKVDIEITEFIEGTVSRIIILGDDFLIADDKEIIHARGDRVVTHEIIAPTYTGLMNFMNEYRPSEERFLILYGIVYGRHLQGNKRYTNLGKGGFALIDGFTAKVADMQNICSSNTPESLQTWSNNLQAPFWPISTRDKFANSFGLVLAPQLKTITLNQVPTDPIKVLNWLWEFTDSQVILDNDDEQAKFYQNYVPENKEPDIDPIPNVNNLNSSGEEDFLASMKNESSVNTKAKNKFKMKHSKLGKSKGIVIRNADRTYIRKLIFEDYIKLKKKK